MSNEYISAAKKVSSLADEFSEDYELVTLLRAGSSKLIKLAQKNSALMKASLNQNKEYKKVVNE